MEPWGETSVTASTLPSSLRREVSGPAESETGALGWGWSWFFLSGKWETWLESRVTLWTVRSENSTADRRGAGQASASRVMVSSREVVDSSAFPRPDSVPRLC